MFVSVIVPTRNRPGELRVALAAIGRQTHALREVVVVDDSPDPDVARENEAALRAGGGELRYIHTGNRDARGSGPALVRNCGLRHARGELIAFCDDDDYWCEERHLEIAVRAFVDEVSLDLVFANQEARRLGALLYPTWLPNMVRSLPAVSLRPDAFARLSKISCLLDNFPHLNACVLRRSLCERIGGFWEATRFWEDLDFFLRALDAASGVGYRHATVAVHNVPDRSVAHGGNVSTAVDERGKQLSATRVAEHVLRGCTTPEVMAYARRFGGNGYRWLAMDARKRSQYAEAARFASCALALRSTWKWRAYTLFLQGRALIRF